MATARITHTFPDGTRDRLAVEVDASYPDAVDEARAQVTRMWREVCCGAVDVDEDTEGPP